MSQDMNASLQRAQGLTSLMLKAAAPYHKAMALLTPQKLSIYPSSNASENNVFLEE